MDDAELRKIARFIMGLKPSELLALNEMLGEEGMPPLTGVREPRRPLPEDDEGHALPPDYWETAE